ncbi:MAG: VRR-NUC domain-containing protein [Coprobacillus sp.]|nr:VRR-NUC domain-containing protein [Coprobacillus sp.]
MALESKHQQAVFKWTQYVRQKYPDLKLLFHIKNEDAMGAKQVAVDKAMGVKKGVPDLFLPVPRGQYHGLFIEMKNETGRPSDAQKWWGQELKDQGYYWEVCHGWEKAVQTLEWYMNL